MATPSITFIGGGNMASAIIGGLIRQGQSPDSIHIVEPWEEQRGRLVQAFPGVGIHAAAGADLPATDLVVWAVKPQMFKEAATAAATMLSPASLHLSVAAGIPSDSIARWLGTERVVRAMPNTPALVGLGMTGLFARDAVSADDRAVVEQVVKTTGELAWVSAEVQLDAVTALSGSGPAYVFFFLEAMTEAGMGMGLTQQQAYQLAVATFAGASSLAAASSESPEVLRQRVTSKGGTTYAAITSMENAGIKPAFVAAMQAAEQRARELGDEFGKA